MAWYLFKHRDISTLTLLNVRRGHLSKRNRKHVFPVQTKPEEIIL